jgi:stalled ribosome rescue protein Dom34
VKEAQEEKYYSSLNAIINQYNRNHFNHAVMPDEQYASSLAEFIMASYPRLTQNLLNGSV